MLSEAERIPGARIMEGPGTITQGIRSPEAAAKELLREWLATRETTTNISSRMDRIIMTHMDRRELITVISHNITLHNWTTT